MLLDREPLALHCALASAAASGIPSSALPSLEPEPLNGWDRTEGNTTAPSLAAVHGAALAASAGPSTTNADASTATPCPTGSKATAKPAAGAHAAQGARLSGVGFSRYCPLDGEPCSAAKGIQAGGLAGPSGSNASSPALQLVRARTFDWARSELLQEKFDVLLACDVLYEDFAVEPIAALVPR